MIELLPCPLCGGEARQHNRVNANTITCRSCGLMVKQSGPGEGDAAKKWNARHTPEGWVIVPGLDEYEHQVLQRFDETTRDDGTYDIDGYMIRTLARKGAVRHITAGRYEMTDAGQAMLAAAPKP